jgi:hypothetical protein
MSPRGSRPGDVGSPCARTPGTLHGGPEGGGGSGDLRFQAQHGRPSGRPRGGMAGGSVEAGMIGMSVIMGFAKRAGLSGNRGARGRCAQGAARARKSRAGPRDHSWWVPMMRSQMVR